jgi:serine/threonine protein kinase
MEAVSVIHNPGHLTSDKKFGRHGDIKAENILWFKSRPDDPHDRGILVLSDLGLTAINSDKSRSMQPNTGLKMTPAYRPPECDIRGGTISRAFDIWTLGCLYLELVCWLLRGKKGKDDFDEVRTTPFIFGTRTDVYFDIEERKYTAPNTYVFKVKDVVFKVSSMTVLLC